MSVSSFVFVKCFALCRLYEIAYLFDWSQLAACVSYESGFCVSNITIHSPDGLILIIIMSILLLLFGVQLY